MVVDVIVSTIDSENSCLNPLVSVNDTTITCTLQPGYGEDVTVVVTIGAQKAWEFALEDSLLSFDGSKLITGTLQFFPEEDNDDYSGVSAPSVTATVSVSIRTNTTDGVIDGIESFPLVFIGATELDGAEVESIVVQYGRLGSIGSFSVLTDTYNCQVVHVFSTGVLCRTTSGVGADLRFQLEVFGIPTDISEDSLSYPPPQLYDTTLQFRDGSSGVITNSSMALAGVASEGDEIILTGKDFGLSSDTREVTFGPTTNPTQYKCTLVSSAVLDPKTELICRVPLGSGGPYVFTVTIGDDNAAQSITGIDTYTYPVAPSIDQVRGCTQVDGEMFTEDCPTAGLDASSDPVILTMYGSDFGGSGATVTVGGAVCANPKHSSTNPFAELSCELPVGVGALQKVIITTGTGLVSDSAPLVSYIAPVVLSVVLDDTEDVANACPRDGNVTVAVIGLHFGLTGSGVLIGMSLCENVVHDPLNPHTRVTCTLPPVETAAGSISLPVVLFQGSGSSSSANSGLLSYARCEPGQIINSSGYDCTPCSAGKYSVTYDAETCSSCAAGFYSLEQAPQCTRCTAGTYSDTEASSNCTECDVGKYAGTSGATGCSACDKGYYADSTSSSVCTLCPEGTYSRNTGAQVCTLCAIGTYQLLLGQDGCDDCTQGRYQNDTGQSSCKLSPLGTYVAKDNAYSFDDCTETTYCDTEGCAACTKCPQGRYANVTGLSRCIPCAVGKYTDGEGTKNCKECGLNEYASYVGSSVCSTCASGRIANVGSEICTLCDPGKRSSDDVNSCLECSTGKYSTTALNTCRECQVGRFGNVTGQTSCVTCEAGYYQDKVARTDCVACEGGRFQTAAGATKCEYCSAGSYAQSGQSSCFLCDEGKTSSTAQANCVNCSEGEYSNVAGASFCSSCSSGQFMKETGATGCLPCIAGKFSVRVSGQVLDHCDLCDTGKFSSSERASSCSDCVEGKFQNSIGASDCEECERGSYASSSGTVNCTLCAPGDYTNFTSSSRCEACAPGAT